MRATGSISRGRTAERHNTRECYRDEEHTPGNIDRSRSAGNVVLVNRELEDVYRERFGAATEEYNARQVEKGHAERQIHDYLAKVRADKQLQPMYEFVVQVGNVDEHPDAATSTAVYRDWLVEFRERYGEHFEVKQAIVHLDEATPHMHVELVPVAESKRGLSVQNSMNKAVKQSGFNDYKSMLAGWDEVLTGCMREHGIERVAGERERQMGGVDIDTYRRSMALAEENERAAERLECLRRREGEASREVADLRGRCEQAERAAVQPPQETVAESLRTLVKARSDGDREGRLANEIEGLRSRISELEGQNQRARGRVEELERGLPALRDRCEGARGRFAAVEQRVSRVIARLRAVPDTLSRWGLEIAHELGKRIYDPRSLGRVARESRAASMAMDSERLRRAAHESAQRMGGDGYRRHGHGR